MDGRHPCAGAILAGGRGSRFQGRNKALLQLGGETILDRTERLFRSFFREIILVTNDPLAYLDRDVVIASDVYDYRSSLTGVHAGLSVADAPHLFVSACDTPFLKPEVVAAVLDHLEPRHDVVIPATRAGLEPLCAIYSRRCLKRMAKHIEARKVKIQWIFQDMQVRKVPESVLMGLDPDLDSFMNVNTPEDLEKARRRYPKAASRPAN
ncbi:MAG: molybdenum cofactor guanylyltransferase [Desulfococcaceae bacterium]